jgi:oxygen-dependent protoporphyrinogen oxidase
MSDFDLIVIGGGPAGLGHAFWRLQRQPDLRVCVLEAAPRVGGWVQTHHVDGFQLELGPQGFRPDDEVDAFLERTGLMADVVRCSNAALRRLVVRGGRLHQLPGRPGALLRSRLLSTAAKLRLLWEPRVRSSSAAGESVAGFVRRRFGRAAVPIAEAMMHGIYAGDAHQLEVAATLPIATDLEREHGSLFRGMAARSRARRAAGVPERPVVCTFGRGMQHSVETLASRLGDRVRTDAPVRAVAPSGDGYLVHGDRQQFCAPQVCITAPPAQAARLLLPLDQQLSDVLAEVPSASVASTYIGFERGAVPEHATGFGFLAPQRELDPVLGAIFTSSVFPHQAPDGHTLFRVMSGGFAHPHEVERSDDSLMRQATTVLQDLLGIDRAPSLRHVSRARNAIPQYVRGHTARLRAIAERLSQHRGLSLRGAGYRKVSVVGQWSAEGSAP